MQKYQKLFLLFLFFSLIFLFPIIAYSDEKLDALTVAADAIEKEIVILEQQLKAFSQESQKDKKKVSTLDTLQSQPVETLAGPLIMISPYLGKRPEFDGSDLVSSLSDINLDIALMQQRETIESLATEKTGKAVNYPLILLSGMVQPVAGIAQSVASDAYGGLSLYSAMLDTSIIMNPWVEGFVTFAAGTSVYNTSLEEIDSSLAVSIDDVFINIGNLDESPFYMTAGQAYVPFGLYETNMISSPLPLLLAETRVPTFMAGYNPGKNDGFLATLFTYSSNTTGGQSGAGGASLGYQFGNIDNSLVNGVLGGSFISNLGDSGGMQNTGVILNFNGTENTFAGFDMSHSTENVHQVPAYDINGLINAGDYGLSIEYLAAIDAFDASALSYNSHGAQPDSGYIEASRAFEIGHRPATFAIGYGWTNESLALNLSKQRIGAILNVSWWRDTVESLQFQHDIDYSSSDYAAGLGSTENTIGSGENVDTIVVSMAIYF